MLFASSGRRYYRPLLIAGVAQVCTYGSLGRVNRADNRVSEYPQADRAVDTHDAIISPSITASCSISIQGGLRVDTRQGSPRATRDPKSPCFYAMPQAMAFMRHVPVLMFLSRDAGYLAFLLAAAGRVCGPRRAVIRGDGAAPRRVTNAYTQSLRRSRGRGLRPLGSKRSRPVEILPVLRDAYDRFLADVQATRTPSRRLRLQTLATPSDPVQRPDRADGACFNAATSPSVRLTLRQQIRLPPPGHRSQNGWNAKASAR